MIYPESHQDLLKDETQAFAVLATTMNNGTPQATPVWFNLEGDYILVNSAYGRTKDRNMRVHPNVALTILDPKDPYRYMQIRGVVMNITDEGAVDHISTLSRKYRGRDYYAPGQKPEHRVIYRIKPEFVSVDR